MAESDKQLVGGGSPEPNGHVPLEHGRPVMPRPEPQCWWAGDGPLHEPMFQPPSWYTGHVGDFIWFCGHLDSLPPAIHRSTLIDYSEIYQSQGRRAANTWLLEGLYS